MIKCYIIKLIRIEHSKKSEDYPILSFSNDIVCDRDKEAGTVEIKYFASHKLAQDYVKIWKNSDNMLFEIKEVYKND